MADNPNKRLVQRPCRPLQSTSLPKRDRQEDETLCGAPPRHDRRHLDLLSNQQQGRPQNLRTHEKTKVIPEGSKPNLLSTRHQASEEQEQRDSSTHSSQSTSTIQTNHASLPSERPTLSLDRLSVRPRAVEAEHLPEYSQIPPDSDISDLWSEVMQARPEIEMDGTNSYDSTQRHTHALPDSDRSARIAMHGAVSRASTQRVQNPLVSIGSPYHIPDGSRIEDICENLKDSKNILKTPVLWIHDAYTCSRVFAEIHERNQRLSRDELLACFFLHRPIKTSATGFPHSEVSPSPEIASEVSPSPEIDALEINPWRTVTQPVKADSTKKLDVSQIVLKYRDTDEKHSSLEFGMVIDHSFEGYIPTFNLEQLKLPCWDTKNDICAPFLSVLCGHDVAKLLDPWTDAACKNLSEFLKMRRHPDISTKAVYAENLRQYGYLSSGASLAIWEMRCKPRKSEGNRNPGPPIQPSSSMANRFPSEAVPKPGTSLLPRRLPDRLRQQPRLPSFRTNNANSVLQPTRLPDGLRPLQRPPSRRLGIRRETPSSLAAPDHSTMLQPRFEIRLVSDLNLAKTEDVIRFNQYHRTILEWGFGKYCLPYANDLMDIFWLKEKSFVGTMTRKETQDYWKDVVEYK